MIAAIAADPCQESQTTASRLDPCALVLFGATGDLTRRKLVPTLDDVTQQAIANQLGKRKQDLPRLRIVHRLDKDTSGLVAFARSVRAERELGITAVSAEQTIQAAVRQNGAELRGGSVN